jgi:hypothetical protein
MVLKPRLGTLLIKAEPKSISVEDIGSQICVLLELFVDHGERPLLVVDLLLYYTLQLNRSDDLEIKIQKYKEVTLYYSHWLSRQRILAIRLVKSKIFVHWVFKLEANG